MLTVCSSGASGVGSDVVSVKEGDLVIFHTDVKTNQQNCIRWHFNQTCISGNLSHICTDVQCNNGTEKFRDRLKLDNQTGSLTITDIRNTDSGVYELKINSSSNNSEKSFNVTVNGESFNACLNAVYMFKVLLMCFFFTVQ